MKIIDKAAVVSELERLYNLEYTNTSNLSCGKKIMLRNILCFLDTLEVKEVDIRKELEIFIEHANAWIKDNREVEYNNGDSFNHIYDLEKIAKHFFELGITVGNKEQKGK